MSNIDPVTFKATYPDSVDATYFCVFGQNPKWRWWKFWEKKTIFYSAPLNIALSVQKDKDFDPKDITIKEE